MEVEAIGFAGLSKIVSAVSRSQRAKEITVEGQSKEVISVIATHYWVLQRNSD